MMAGIINELALLDSYGTLVRWIGKNGYECTGAPYEIYVKTGSDSLPVEGRETEVYFLDMICSQLFDMIVLSKGVTEF